VSRDQHGSHTRVTAKTWIRDGLDRAVVATDFNRSDGSVSFKGSRPVITSRLAYDTLGRIVSDVTDGTFPITSPTLPGMSNVTLGDVSWDHPASFLGPNYLSTLLEEQMYFEYTSKGTLASLTREGFDRDRLVQVSYSSQGGDWVYADVSSAGAQLKGRDAFGHIRESSAILGAAVAFRQDLLRGPTGRITAERWTGPLLGTHARSYSYDALGRLNALRIDNATSMTRASFLSEVDAALGNEDWGFDVVTPDVTQDFTKSPADVLLEATPDHLGRGYFAEHDELAAGVPLTQVDYLPLVRDEHDRVVSDTELGYTFDVFDRLVLVMRGSTEELRIAYDGLGRRKLEKRLVTRPTGTVVEDAYLEYAGPNVIEESIAGDTTILTTITHAPAIDAPLVVGVGPTSEFTPTYLIGTNARGDAVYAGDLDAEVSVEEAHLDAWGDRVMKTPSISTCVEGNEASMGSVLVSRPSSACAQHSDVLQRFGIGGARLHARTKLVDLRNRVYATHQRAFLTKDPLGSIDSYGLWNYVAGDPINFRDPWGLTPKTEDAAPMVFKCGDDPVGVWLPC
jgi:RHS repeat-associated protein